MRARVIIVALLLVGLAAGTAREARSQKAEKILMVVQAGNKVGKLGKDWVRNVYLGSVTFWDGSTRIRPFNRPPEGGPGKQFFRDVLRMTPSRYRHHWQKQQLSGQGVAPEVVKSASAVIAKVAETSGGVGYILESEKVDDNRVRYVPVE
jgi:ABC-type phosphate transport system substrate-binding protein